MLYLLLKAALSGVIVAAISQVAKRYPGFGGLISSLPLVSVLGMIWLWRDTHDPDRMSAHVSGTLWFIAPSLPMFWLNFAEARRHILVRARCRLRPDDGPICLDGVGRAPVWNPPLAPQPQGKLYRCRAGHCHSLDLGSKNRKNSA